MARKPLQKQDKYASNIETNFNFYKAGIGVVNSKGKVESIQEFLINPDSIEDSKSVNWASHNIPGQESPVYQWTSGGPRVLSFEALVTYDTIYLTQAKKNPLQNLQNTAINAIGSIASSFLGVQLPPLAGLLAKQAEIEDFLSINDQLDFYRSLYRPKYTQNEKLESSPPLVVLYLGSSLGMEPLPSLNDEITKFSLLWMLTSLNIKITKWLPNLSPIEASVNFQFTQYQITSIRQPEQIG